MMVNIDVQYLQRSLVLLVTSASDLTMCLTINFVVLHKQDSQMRGAASFVSRDQQTPPLSAETYTPPLKCWRLSTVQQWSYQRQRCRLMVEYHDFHEEEVGRRGEGRGGKGRGRKGFPWLEKIWLRPCYFASRRLSFAGLSFFLRPDLDFYTFSDSSLDYSLFSHCDFILYFIFIFIFIFYVTCALVKSLLCHLY